MAEQAAIGQDVIDLADALKIPGFAVAGYDWGGRAAGIAAALHPERVRPAVLIGGYTIQDVFGTPPRFLETERQLVRRPRIEAPTIALMGEATDSVRHWQKTLTKAQRSRNWRRDASSLVPVTSCHANVRMRFRPPFSKLLAA
jgi:pimeloyl-ACP methyl ester carboxylesterase